MVEDVLVNGISDSFLFCKFFWACESENQVVFTTSNIYVSF